MTRDETITLLRIAMEAWLAAAYENGLSIPQPRFRPATVAAE
ncbi:MAG: hypothetical protein WAU59_12150 [Rhodoplanes sp.]